MIDLATLAGLHEHDHRLDAYCLRCDRWAEIDLAAMVAAGHGDPGCRCGSGAGSAARLAGCRSARPCQPAVPAAGWSRLRQPPPVRLLLRQGREAAEEAAPSLGVIPDPPKGAAITTACTAPRQSSSAY